MGMQKYTCPNCGATHDGSRLSPQYPWNLIYRFRCQTCAMMLRFTPGRRIWYIPLLLLVIPAAAAFANFFNPPNRVAILFAAIVGTLIATFVIRWIIPMTAVIDSTE